MKSPLTVSIDDVVKELQREQATRERVYPQWKREGKLNANTADHRLECIKKAISYIKQLQPKQGQLLTIALALSLLLFSCKGLHVYQDKYGNKYRTHMKPEPFLSK